MIDFIKMQGTGNNYIYIDLISNALKNIDFSDLSKKISDVNFGIGSDGLILICKSLVADAKMIIYNKDGSEAKMCGNGIRCVAKYLYDKLLKKNTIMIETKSGIKKVDIKILNNGEISIIVNMGVPIFEPRRIPVILNDEIIIQKEVEFNNRLLKINCVSLGNPHTVIFLDNIDDIDIKELGNSIQKSKIFPNQCNVEFVQVLSRNKIKMRVWEIGSGETYSCGTGACASVICGILNGFLDEKSKVEVDATGGVLYVTYDKNVYLEGPAVTICYGKYLYDPIIKRK